MFILLLNLGLNFIGFIKSNLILVDKLINLSLSINKLTLSIDLLNELSFKLI